MTEVLADTSRDLSQYQQTLPPLTHRLLSPGFPLSGWQAAPKTPGLTPRGKIRAHLRVEFLNFSLVSGCEAIGKKMYTTLKIVCYLQNEERNPLCPLLSAAITRRTAVCDHYILISGRIWAGGGSISLRGTTPTSALVPVLTYAAQTPPTARLDKVPQHLIKARNLFGKYGSWSLSPSALSSVAAESVQHVEPRSIRLTLLCSSGLGAPHHPLLRWPLP